MVEDGLIEHYRYSESNNTDSPLELVNEGAPVKGGDCLILKSGYHGYLDVNTFIFDDWLTIKGAVGEDPVLAQINLVGAFRRIAFANITINKESYNSLGGNSTPWYQSSEISGAALYCASNSFWGDGSDLKFREMRIMSAADSSAGALQTGSNAPQAVLPFVASRGLNWSIRLSSISPPASP